MTPKQKRFCDEYLIDCNATQAAIRAGYSEKTAYSIGQRLLKDVEVSAYIAERAEAINSKTIANATEVMQYLTSVLRDEETEEVIVVAGIETKRMNKGIGARDKLKAAELLAKRYGLLTDKFSVEGVIPIVISGDDDLEE